MQDLMEKDRQYIWHPCVQMKDFETFPPFQVVRAQGSYFELADGRKMIDAISSWWCKLLGHQHPRLKKVLAEQMDRFEHVIFANTTNETIVQLSEKLCQLMPGLDKVFYAGDGSSAVEIAMKMSVHAREITGETARQQFIALENDFHGETLGALSVSDVGIFKDPYRSMVFSTTFITPPYVNNVNDPLWHNCESHWKTIEKKLAPLAETTTAIIVEPILQGSGHMKIYSQDFLRRLYAWAKENNIHFIADEILTGLGRMGKMLACEYAEITPDFICLAKNLTAGWMPMSAVLTSNAIYNLFYDDYETGNTFLHSHTFSGNVLSAAIANEVFNIIQEENICEKAQKMGEILRTYLSEIAEETGRLKSIRGVGGMAAADLMVDDPERRMGFEIFQKATQLGAYLRPLGNTIYWFPPVTTELQTLRELKQMTQQAIQSVKFK